MSSHFGTLTQCLAHLRAPHLDSRTRRKVLISSTQKIFYWKSFCFYSCKSWGFTPAPVTDGSEFYSRDKFIKNVTGIYYCLTLSDRYLQMFPSLKLRPLQEFESGEAIVSFFPLYCIYEFRRGEALCAQMDFTRKFQITTNATI